MSNEVAIQNLSVVDAAHDLGQPGERLSGFLQSRDQRRDDRARTGARDARKPIAGRAQGIDRPNQADAPNATAFADQIDRVQSCPLPSKLGYHNSPSQDTPASASHGDPAAVDAEKV